MLRNNLCFPYPVLRTTPIDFKEGILDTKIKKEIIDNNYVLTVDIDTKSHQISKCINDGLIIKAIFVESGALKYKKTFNVTNNNKVFIPCNEIYGKVEIQPCLICKQPINPYYSADFNDDFKGFEINLNKGDIIGIGDTYEFDALLEKDDIKNISSIFLIDESCDNYISYDIAGQQVVIYLPKEMKKDYELIRKIKDTYPILNSIIVFPILCELIKYCLNDEDYDYKWYLVLNKKINELKEKKIISQSEDDPLKIAQIIVNSLQEKGLYALNKIIENIGGDIYEN